MKTLLACLSAAACLTMSLFAEEPKNVSLDEAQKLLKDNPKLVVIDVRTPAEFAAGHIAGAKNLDVMAPDFAKQVAALDKDKTYLIHCAAGGRSGRACKLPEVQQLKSVYHMNEGFKAWETAGKPVEKTEAAK